MTNEQREAVEICKEKIIEPFYNFPNPISIELKDTDVGAIETILSLIKEQQEKIAKYEKIYKEYDCYRWVKELDKKDKTIDLMAEFIATLDIEEDICANIENDNCDKMAFGECENCIKQYFADKVEKE